jgi:hypothetical protein
MEEYEEKTNSEIMLELKQMENDFNAIKIKMQKDYTLLEIIEKKYNNLTKYLEKRLTGK